MFADVSTFFGAGILNILILTAIAGILYCKWFPNNEPGEIAKGGFIKWLTRKILG